MKIYRITYLFLFFCFFISFAVINFPSSQWGLQMSWALGIIMLFMFPLIIGCKFCIGDWHNFKLISFFFILLVINSLISWILQYKGLIVFKELDRVELLSRSFPHCIYLTYEYLLYIFLVAFLSKKSRQHIAINWFIVYPFYIITIYGVYQWLTTFNIVPYTEIFNNNASTGFTYLRFKAEHRSCSVFPEPSEYAYYLGFLLPFILSPYYNKNKDDVPVFFKQTKISLLLYVFAVFSTGSMSLFAVLPIIFMIVARSFIKLSTKFYFYIIGICFVILGAILALQGDRIIEMMTGNDGSAITRLKAFEDTLNLFIGSPIIGGGFGAVRGLDLLSFLLGTTGIIGTGYFLFMIYKIKSKTYTNKIFKCGLICMIIVALMSNPIIDHTFFWPILAFNTVSIKY